MNHVQIVTALLLSCHVQSLIGRPSATVEDIASEYIANRLFSKHSHLASKLLAVLARLSEHQYEQLTGPLDQKLRSYDGQSADDNNDDEDDDSLGEKEATGSDVGLPRIELMGGSGTEQLPGSEFKVPSDSAEQKKSSKFAGRRLYAKNNSRRRFRRIHYKRGIGGCVSSCLRSPGRMDFAECRNMCI